MKKIKVGTLFSGIGAFEQALKKLNIDHEIEFACDTGGLELEKVAKKHELEKLYQIEDKFEQLQYAESLFRKARKINHVKNTYLKNYDLDENYFFHDVRFVGSHINKEIDILVGGSPCQSFSFVGKLGGFKDTRGTLFFDYVRCIKEFQPDVFIFENVKGLTFHDKGRTFAVVLNTFEELGYKYFWKVLNAKDYGIPQNRNRIFVIGFKDHSINFKFPKPIPLTKKVSDFLEKGPVDDKYYLKESYAKVVLEKHQYNINRDIAQTILTNDTGTWFHLQNFVLDEKGLRHLTVLEKHRLMGFPDDFKVCDHYLNAKKQAGNSIVVNVLEHIMMEILKTGVFDD